MNVRYRIPKPAALASVIVAVALVAFPAAGRQDGRPQPIAPAPRDLGGQGREGRVPAAPLPSAPTNGRRLDNGEKVILAFNSVTIKDTLPFIVQTTGKVVMPASTTAISALMLKKITLVNDEPISRTEALDLLFSAFSMNDVGVIETDDRIILALRSDITTLNPPVIGPDETLLGRSERGIIVTKIFAVKNTDADDLASHLEPAIPDTASMSVDPNSNQIIVIGPIALCQHLQKLIDALDNTYIKVKTETFRLAYADAAEVRENIMELFEEQPTPGRAAGSQRVQSTRRASTPAQRAAQAARRSITAASRQTGAGPTVELRVTVNVSQNSVTVSGEPTVIEAIAQLIATEWDVPRSEATKKVYHLKYTDPIKMRDMLQELLGQRGGIGRAGPGRAGAAGGGRANVSDVISGIYKIEAYPDSNSLVVICKTEESFKFLDSLIEDLDQPLYPGLPIIVELKHADAEEVADQINAIFAPTGTSAELRRRERGVGAQFDLTGPAGNGGAGDAGGAGGVQGGGMISFPWQTGRQGTDEEAEPSPLIGKVRVVPIHRQNAVMILAAPEYRDAVKLFVDQLDRPGRQVLITAVIAEVELTDDFALGIRYSNVSSILGGPLADNRFGLGGQIDVTEDNLFGSIFNTSILSANMPVNVLLQALAQVTNIRILQEPMVFTADNQEASFFEGQDVPILQTTQGNQGFISESVVYQAVGIGLNVRPRITAEGDVDLEINLEISNIDPSQTVANQPFFDRRETTTHVIVKNGQTIVISGIMRELESTVERKVPLLGDIPLLGELFKSREQKTTRTELIAFVTPLIVDNPDENDSNFNERAREKLQELSRPLEEQKPRQTAADRTRRRLLLPQIGGSGERIGSQDG
ncbi:MAG: hypothetical protein IH888_08660 [Planctomycetes bacterium]|nr:hypothetical protein [Planctomycetota bacterium]